MPDCLPSACPDVARGIDRLLSGLQWQTTVFHVGRYCGQGWRASTAGHAMAGFHIVLQGQCHLHRPGHAPVALSAGDGVFLLRDTPHSLSAGPDAPAAPCAPSAMQPLAAGAAEGTGLACGFFQFSGALSGMVLRALPEVLVLRAASDAAPAALLVDCMLREAQASQASDPAHSPVMARLTDLLFFYVVRHAVRQGEVPAGLWQLLRSPELAPLLLALLDDPGRAWDVEQMAQAVHMSRARFFRAFQRACGQAPAAFLAGLRMQVAAQRIERGERIARAAEHVGYQSYAAFSRAFKKFNGVQPGAWQRLRTQPGTLAPH